jgi:ubiquinone/menaquinone biosynthesis C-methylase UbiE
MADVESWKRQDRRYHEDPAVVESYDRRIVSKYRLEHEHYSVEPWVRQVQELPDPLILDCGCGTGAGTLRLLAHGLRVVSLDASQAMLDRLRAKALALGLTPRCVAGDVERPPFPPESFDGVLCLGVLHHVPDAAAALDGMLRVLKPGGRVLIAEPYRHKPWLSWPYHAAVAAAKGLRGLLRSPGPTTLERPLGRAQLARMEERLRAGGVEYTVRRLVYWPAVCGWLPDRIAFALTEGLNRVHGRGRTADSIVLNGRKSP